MSERDLLVLSTMPRSGLMHLRFAASESAFDYFHATRQYLERHGKPVAFYSDKHAVTSGQFFAKYFAQCLILKLLR